MLDYPECALEEGIVNTLIHRAYLRTGAHSQIDTHYDHMVITNPGIIERVGSKKQGTWLVKNSSVVAIWLQKLLEKTKLRRMSGFPPQYLDHKARYRANIKYRD